MIHHIKTNHTVLLAFLISSILAMPAQGKYLYRYNDNGVQRTTGILTQKHRDNGYEVLNSEMRLIKTVPPYDAKAAQTNKIELEKENKAKQVRFQIKQKLIKTYGSSHRAVRKRSDILAGIKTKLLFAQQQLQTANTELKSELDKAGNLEKAGKPINEGLKNAIATKRRAVESAQASLNDLVTQQYKQLDNITRDIRKLRYFEKHPN